MSAETATPKTSFLTRAMQNVEAMKTAKDSNETVIPTSEEVAAKRLLKKIALTTVGVMAVGAAVMIVANRAMRDEETSDETTISED